MAIWIRLTEETVSTTAVSPKDGQYFTLEELQGYVEGYVETLRLDHGRVMWLNEEGKLHDLPVNPPATLMAVAEAGISRSDWIAGNVLITGPEEIRNSDDDGEEEE